MPKQANGDFEAACQQMLPVISEETDLVNKLSVLYSCVTEATAPGAHQLDAQDHLTTLSNLQPLMKEVMNGLNHAIAAQNQLILDVQHATGHATKAQPAVPPLTRVIFMGNPGTGKSTIINCLRGQADCQSGISFGGGLTAVASEHVAPDCVYVDTPGLADAQIEERAATEITAALKKGGRCKLIFFVRLEAGRIVSNDLVTLQRILETLGSDELHMKFSIIINNVSPKMFQSLTMPDSEANQQVLALINSTKFTTGHVIFIPRADTLLDKDNAIDQLPDEVGRFVINAPVIDLVPSQISAIDTTNYRAMAEELRDNIEALRQDKAAQQQKLAQLHQQMAPDHRSDNSRGAYTTNFNEDVEMLSPRTRPSKPNRLVQKSAKNLGRSNSGSQQAGDKKTQNKGWTR